MARHPSPPRIVNWRGKPHTFHYDFSKRRTVRKCVQNLTQKQRTEKLRDLTVEFRDAQADVLRGYREETAFDTNLIEALEKYRTTVKERVKLRIDNPGRAQRVGMAEASGYALEVTLDQFTEWLEQNGKAATTTGNLSAHDLEAFFRSLLGGKTRRGEKPVRRSVATVNKARRNLATCLRWLSRGRPRMFPDRESLEYGCKLDPVPHPEPKAFTPDDLKRFYNALVEREQPNFIKTLKDERRGQWKQTATATSATKQSRLFLLIALLGCRRGEALGLKWEDVDLERGRITVHAPKTGRRRIVPLSNTPELEGDIAPAFLKVLKRWKLAAGDREYVLGHDKPTEACPRPSPTYVKRAWVEVGNRVGLRDLTPQRLRQNFTSYCASLGVPATVSALWQGHGVNVAERHYRAQLLERADGDSIEAAMGFGFKVYDGGSSSSASDPLEIERARVAG